LADKDSVSDRAAWVLSLLAGAIGWLALATSSGREAWDVPQYFTVLVPAAVVVSGLLGFLVPRRAWRWGLGLFAGQATVAFALDPTGGLLPLGLLVFGFLSIPAVIAAALGAFVSRRLPGRGQLQSPYR
jgi:peptidoglycan/LPS O-acetylase OafA/YrhL